MTETTLVVQAPFQSVYRALTTAHGWMDWFCNSCDLEARAGGRIYLWNHDGFQAAGKFDALREDRQVRIVFEAPEPASLDFRLESKNGETIITVRHEGSLVAPLIERLENLQAVLETGLDRRVYDRPMLGVLIAGAIEPENQKRYNMPFDYGIIIGDAIKGMGAAKAGLGPDDVLTEMEGTALTDYDAIARAIAPHKSGDTVRVVWFRQGERYEADMRLSGRPQPGLPASVQELAEDVRQLYARLDAELAELLEGVSEAEAEFRPAVNEWNIKEVLAHVIVTERATQIWLVNAFEGSVFNNWASSSNPLVRSVVDIHPTLADLTAELHRMEAQTVALLRQLPEDIVVHKGTFHDIVTTVGPQGLSIHTRLHYDTIKNLIEQARQS